MWSRLFLAGTKETNKRKAFAKNNKNLEVIFLSPPQVIFKSHCKVYLWREREYKYLLTNFNKSSMMVDVFRYSLSFNFHNNSIG